MTPTGRPVAHRVHSTDEGALLEVRPTKGDFVDGRIADYVIGLRRTRDEGEAVYEIATRIERAEEPLSPALPRPEDLEGTGRFDPTDDPIGMKNYKPVPENPLPPDPSDVTKGPATRKAVPETPGKADPFDDPLGKRTPEPEGTSAQKTLDDPVGRVEHRPEPE